MTHPIQTDADGLRDLLTRIRYDTTAIQARVTDALTLLSRLNLPDTARNICPIDGCGYRSGTNLPSIAEHVHQAHDGPLPDHWRAEDAEADR